MVGAAARRAIATPLGDATVLVTVQPAPAVRAGGLPKLPALDGLRALAILIVMVSHTSLGRAIPGGFGVTIFFFLSGYLITTLLRLEAAETGGVSLRRFYTKRTLRIMPPLYLTVLLVAGAAASGAMEGDVRAAGVAADLLFLTNYAPAMGIGGGVLMPLWSLDVEEHFYILFSALFAFVFVRSSSRRAAEICLAIALGSVLLRQALAWHADDLTQVYYWSHTRLDSILWGSMLALWRNPAVDADAWRPTLGHVAGALVVLGICLVNRDPVFRETVRYMLQGGALVVIFSYALQDRGLVGQVLGCAPLRVVALLSYTLYLAHVPALALAEAWRLPAVCGLALAFGYAGVMYVIVERPLARWGRRVC